MRVCSPTRIWISIDDCVSIRSRHIPGHPGASCRFGASGGNLGRNLAMRLRVGAAARHAIARLRLPGEVLENFTNSSYTPADYALGVEFCCLVVFLKR